jgi:hypothetical protein
MELIPISVILEAKKVYRDETFTLLTVQENEPVSSTLKKIWVIQFKTGIQCTFQNAFEENFISSGRWINKCFEF